MGNYAIIDMQYGSTGKGLIAGYMAATRGPDVGVSAFGPNAGHTYIDHTGTYIHTMLPMAVFSPQIEKILIGPGSVLDLEALKTEVSIFAARNKKHFKIYIHPNTPILQNHHKYEEEKFVAIGSTMKGTAACVIEKMLRSTAVGSRIIASQYHGAEPGLWFTVAGVDVVVCSHKQYQNTLMDASLIQVEGAQGHSLSIHGPFYPFCTSRDVSAHQLLADCAVPYGIDFKIVGTMRTYPIRVANRYASDGVEIGYSGSCYSDQREMEWDEIGVVAEKTTVTKLPRRLFSFSMDQILDAKKQNKVEEVFLNFCNYLTSQEMKVLLDRLADAGVHVDFLGYGPTKEDILPREFL